MLRQAADACVQLQDAVTEAGVGLFLRLLAPAGSSLLPDASWICDCPSHAHHSWSVQSYMAPHEQGRESECAALRSREKRAEQRGTGSERQIKRRKGQQVCEMLRVLQDRGKCSY